jgi:tyrosyl-tRNA synthetase
MPETLPAGGHKPVALVGGATGLIGDPSFKAAERKLNTEDTVQEWVDKIRKQVAPFLDFDCGENSGIAANNYDWFGSMNVLTFLRDIGKHFSVNQMINKEAVKQRLNRDDQGISFTEFSYNLLQGYDFACLNKLHGVALQIGGSDQWGNITSGIDLTRRLHQNQVFGLTVPLITKRTARNSVKPKAAQCGWIRRKPARTNSTSSGSTPRMPTFIAS